jgi:TPR repeat protein
MFRIAFLIGLSLLSGASFGAFADGMKALAAKKPTVAIDEFAIESLRGDLKSTLLLVHLYSAGKVVDKSASRVDFYLKDLEATNSPFGLALLAELYLSGISTPKNAALAFKNAQRAAALGSDSGMLTLARILIDETEFRNVREAGLWVRKCAELGNPNCHMFLGRLHNQGIGVSNDLVQAAAWFDLAAKAQVRNAADQKSAVLSRMSSAEISTANRLSLEYQGLYVRTGFGDSDEKPIEKFFMQYASERRLLELDAMLSAESLANDTDLSKVKLQTAKAYSFLSSSRQQFIRTMTELYSKMENKILTPDQSESLKQSKKIGYDLSLSAVERLWVLETEALVEFDKMVSLLSRYKDAWKLENQKILFNYSNDLDDFRAAASRRKEAYQKILELGREMADFDNFQSTR